MKITKRQLQRIIAEEKQRLSERRAYGHGSGNVDDPVYHVRMALKRNPNASRAELEEELMTMDPAYRMMNRGEGGWLRVEKFLDQQGIFENRQLNEEEVDAEEFFLGELDAMAKAADNLRVQLEELEPQMRDVASRIPGYVSDKNKRAVLLQIIDEAAEALDDLERHFDEARSRMGGWRHL